MIKTIEMTNILSINNGIKIIPVNTVGVMGKGLALQFKNKYPEFFNRYQSDCKTGKLGVGKIAVYKNWVMFPTKQDWRKDSTKEIIRASLVELKALLVNIEAKLNVYPDVYIPKIGCGCGNMKSEVVEQLIRDYLEDRYNNIYLIGF